MNRQQIRRTLSAGVVPPLSELLNYELAVNVPDKVLYIRLGTEVIALNKAENIVTDSTHMFVTQAQIDAWNTGYTLPIASDSVLGGVKVPASGIIGIDATGSISIAKADGSTAGYLSAEDWTAFSGKQAALGFTPVNKAGDTMTGALVLFGSPTADNEASNKKYVDDTAAGLLPLAGGTMNGPLILSGDPTQGLGAVTKQYLDTAISSISGSYGAPVQSLTELTAIGAATLMDKQLRLVEDTGAVWRYDVQSTIPVDGTGVVAPDDAVGAGRWIKVQAATQNHNALNGLQGGALNDYLHLTTAEKNSYDAHLVDTALHLSSAQNDLLDALTVSAAELNNLSGLNQNIMTLLDGKQAALGYTPVNKAGDTMTGELVLFGDAVNALGAVSLQQLQNYTFDGGEF